MNGEVEEIRSNAHSTHESWRWPWDKRRLKLEPNSVRTSKQGKQLKDDDTNWQQGKERLQKTKELQFIKTHALASTTFTDFLSVSSHFTHWLLGFSLCTSCHQCNCCDCNILFHFWPVREFLVEIHTAKMVLWGVVFTPAVGCSRPPSAVNDPTAKRKIVKVARLKKYPKTANNGSHGSIMSLCTFAYLWTFFELLWAPPRIAPLPPTGGSTRWLVPVLILPEWHWPELSFSRFLV